jgi:hypothetical protein
MRISYDEFRFYLYDMLSANKVDMGHGPAWR